MLYRKEIPSPIEKVELGKKKKSTYYLTANLFYSSVHFAVRKQVVDQAKLFLKPHLQDCPKLGKNISISIGYRTEKKTKFDLDNKAYLLQTMGKIEDDNVDYITQIHYFFLRGPNTLVIQVNKT